MHGPITDLSRKETLQGKMRLPGGELAFVMPTFVNLRNGWCYEVQCCDAECCDAETSEDTVFLASCQKMDDSKISIGGLVWTLNGSEKWPDGCTRVKVDRKPRKRKST